MLSRSPFKKPSFVRPIRVDGELAYVPLTKGYEAVIDVADVPIVVGHNWRAQMSNNTVYAATSIGGRKNKKNILLHRVLMCATGNSKVDHRDCNGLNNRRLNLRFATTAQNTQNQNITKRNTSGIKGVSWDKSRGKWVAHIGVEGRVINLGRYDSIDEAKNVRIEAAEKLHGEFCRA